MTPPEEDTHILVRLEISPGYPDEYLGPCGYRGTDKREFIDATKKSLNDVTCPECLNLAGWRKEIA